MSAASTVFPAGHSRVAPALAELCAGHDELGRFMAQCFGELDALAAEFGGRLSVRMAERGGTENAVSGAAIQQELREMERQRTAWEHEQSMLENELETVRARAAENAELLVQQRQLMAQQQAEWMEEFKQMRRLLEAMARRLFDQENSSATHVARKAVAGLEDSHGDPVLDSVMAQFQRLQKDLVRRK